LIVGIFQTKCEELQQKDFNHKTDFGFRRVEKFDKKYLEEASPKT